MTFPGGKFRVHPGQVKSTGSKTPPASSPQEKVHGEPQAPHGGGSEEHITKTHPGTTSPHPETGVHAVSIHHKDGKYTSHTHHDGGNVETKPHDNAADAKQAVNDAFPDQGDNNMAPGNDMRDGGADFGEQLGGIGGESA